MFEIGDKVKSHIFHGSVAYEVVCKITAILGEWLVLDNDYVVNLTGTEKEK